MLAAGGAADTQRRRGVAAVDSGHVSRQLLRVRLVLQDDDTRLRARRPSLDRLPPGPSQLRRTAPHQPTSHVRRRAAPVTPGSLQRPRRGQLRRRRRPLVAGRRRAGTTRGRAACPRRGGGGGPGGGLHGRLGGEPSDVAVCRGEGQLVGSRESTRRVAGDRKYTQPDETTLRGQN